MDHLLLGLAANPALPPLLLGRLVDRLVGSGPGPDEADGDTDGAAEVAVVLAERPDLGRAHAAALTAAYGEDVAVPLAERGLLAPADVDPAAWPLAALALLRRGTAPGAWARALAMAPEPRHRALAAAEPAALTADAVELLAADPDPEVVSELALEAGPELAARLARHPHAEVRLAVAHNRATPPPVLRALLTGDGLPAARACLVCDREPVPFSHDPQCGRVDCELPADAACDGTHQSTGHRIRQAALGNPATPGEAAARFADSPSMLLRWSLAGHPGLPQAAYARLAADPVPGIRQELAGNPGVGTDVLRVLCADTVPEVRRAAVHHPGLPPEVVAALARSPQAGLRGFLAQRRDLPDAVREALADDPDASVAARAAAHPGLSEARLRSLLDRFGDQVAAGVAANPDAPAALLEELAERPNPPRKALRAIAVHPRATARALRACLADHRARRPAAGRPELPVPDLLRLLTDPDPQVVEAAAANPALPPGVMAALVAGAAPAEAAGNTDAPGVG
ncbi:hypothetical protein DEJ50_06090 [Streptomyces venezuelae]|uniref:Leucine rich repeat variant n=1 Tax=Streptomyces venezuelae TaxID=54571 RepID=A0A5P2CYV1_STRVZ|nr:DUF2336 domain-containing protein [Streptomyces venezuelae]QES47460.1 hypothetical protein DEJ50_06090 [Streptomyces venezuelae]